jgi:flagellar basal-body rod modification protein FlgD
MSTIQTSTYTDPTKLGLNGDTGTKGASSGTLDKDGFLKLFVAQLQHQDPSSPMDTTQSMEQMASFSMVEQITNMASQNTQIAKTLATSSAVGLIGRTVTYLDSSGQTQTGKVESVATSKDGLSSLTVAGKAGVDPASISTVA